MLYSDAEFVTFDPGKSNHLLNLKDYPIIAHCLAPNCLPIREHA